MEIFNICLAHGWAIESVKNGNFGENAKYDLFAQFDVFYGQIAWIYDICTPSDETIKECEKIAIFKQMCEFNVYISDDNDEGWTKKVNFTGTFVDALEYIKANFGK